MAADSRDPITGSYIFSDTGAPDIGVDPTLVSAQANDVGTRIVRANLPALEAYEYKRKGLAGHALDTGTEYVHDGSGWVSLGDIAPATGTPTVAAGWATPSVNTVSRVDGIATLTFNASRTSNSVVDGVAVTVPVGFRAASSPNIYGHAWGLAGAASSIQVWYDTSSHVVRLRQTVASGQSIALTFIWRVAG